jgi:catalase
MLDTEQGVSRRNLLATAGGRSIAGVLGSTTMSAASTSSPTAVAQGEVTAEEVTAALEGAYGVHHGQRRNHAKGTGALGTFVGMPEAALYSRSALFSGEAIQVVARFSLAGGNPNAADTERSTRGMALEFRLPNGSLHHMTMLNTPMFFGDAPRTFLDKMIALKPDPATGKPDPEKLEAFAASHPDNTAQAGYLEEHNPPASYASSAYYGIHTFKFINSEGKVTLVRYRFVPQDGEKPLSDAQMKSMPVDFLEQALIDRTQQGPVIWDMLLTIGRPGDPETNPTVLWPAARPELKVGTLTIWSAMPQEAGSYKINYDPLVMGDGVAPTNDPILLFRSPSYALSFTKRLRDL